MSGWALKFHQNYVLPDAGYAVPGDHIILFPTKQTKKSAWSRDHDRKYLSCDRIQLNIIYEAKAAAVANIDYLFAAQVVDSTLHGKHPRESLFTGVP